MLTLLLALAAAASDPPFLTVVGPDHPVLVARDGLLSRPDLRVIEINDPDLGGKVQVSAVQLIDLFTGTPKGAESLEVTCADGFVATLPLAAVQNRDPAKPIAYLAVDRADAPWVVSPRLAASGAVAGPFAVVWTLPPGQQVGREQWPYQVLKVGFSVPLANRFPHLTPGPGESPRRGFDLYLQNCLPCHQLNGDGPAQVGPDLNEPHNPLEYLGRERFVAYLRDPQSLHVWPGSKMPSFDKQVMSDAQLTDLIAYLSDRQKARQH